MSTTHRIQRGRSGAGGGRVLLAALEALGLYRRAGFAEIEPFGEYAGSPLSACLAKPVG